MDILECRNEIDKIDKKLVELLEKRMDIAINVAKYKIKNNMPIFNATRELEIIEKSINRLNDKEYSNITEKFFNYLMSLSREVQEKVFEENK